jgi:hypothetical protein
LSAVERYVRNVAEDMHELKAAINENGKRMLELDEKLTTHGRNDEKRHQDVKKSVRQAGIDMNEQETRNNIIQWLSHTDPNIDHNAACTRRESQTGNWFINGKDYSQWEKTPGSFLWLYGIPGCGKTILW